MVVAAAEEEPPTAAMEWKEFDGIIIIIMEGVWWGANAMQPANTKR